MANFFQMPRDPEEKRENEHARQVQKPSKRFFGGQNDEAARAEQLRIKAQLKQQKANTQPHASMTPDSRGHR